jgi:hypothetical protein
MKNKIFGLALLAFVLYFVISRPADAGHVTKAALHGLHLVADGIIEVIVKMAQ